jgi:hypothetical protein
MSKDIKKIVNIVSNIRVTSNYAKSYINQISSQTEKYYQIGKIILICDDLNSPSEILNWDRLDKRVVLVQENKNDFIFDSIEDKTLQWAALCNQGVESSLIFQSDFTLFIEADLCFPFDLIDQLILKNLDITAPVVFLGAGFYDSWGFRKLDGSKISWIGDVNVHTPPAELSSVGSCVLFRTEIFSRGVRFRGPFQTGLLVGVCNDARELGYKVWALFSVSIIHPTTSWRGQVWKIKRISINLNGKVFVVNGDYIIAGAYAEFIFEQLSLIFKALPEIPIERGEYRFDFIKNQKDRTVEVEVTNLVYSSARFKFSI